MYGNVNPNPGGLNRLMKANSTHYYSNEEVRAFSQFINSRLKDDPSLAHLLPLNHEKHDAFFAAFKDGMLFCKLINVISPGSINPNHITKSDNLIFQVQNLNTALNAAKGLRINLTNIGAEDISSGTRHIILGALWQVIKYGLLKAINLVDHPELAHLLSKGEDTRSFAALEADKVILRWFNHNLMAAGHNRQVNNFASDIMDGQNYLVLMSHIAPQIVPKQVLSEQDPPKRAQLVCEYAAKMGIEAFVTPRDILAGNPNLNLAFTADMFNKYPALAASQYDALEAKAIEEGKRRLEQELREREAERAARWAQEERDRKAMWESEDAQRRAMQSRQEEEMRKKLEESERRLEEARRREEELGRKDKEHQMMLMQQRQQLEAQFKQQQQELDAQRLLQQQQLQQQQQQLKQQQQLQEQQFQNQQQHLQTQQQHLQTQQQSLQTQQQNMQSQHDYLQTQQQQLDAQQQYHQQQQQQNMYHQQQLDQYAQHLATQVPPPPQTVVVTQTTMVPDPYAMPPPMPFGGIPPLEAYGMPPPMPFGGIPPLEAYGMHHPMPYPPYGAPPPDPYGYQYTTTTTNFYPPPEY